MSKTLSFGLYYCLRNPEVMEAIQEEIDQVTGLSWHLSLTFYLLSPSCYLGDRSFVNLEDRPQLAYTEAALLEVDIDSISNCSNTWAGLSSGLCPPHCPTKENPEYCESWRLHLACRWHTPQMRNINNITIVGSLVQINLYSMHRKKEIWNDPENFRPERFLVSGAVVQVVSLIIRFKHIQCILSLSRMNGFNLSPTGRGSVSGSS